MGQMKKNKSKYYSQNGQVLLNHCGINSHSNQAVDANLDCDRVIKEFELFKMKSASAIKKYRDQFNKCGIKNMNGIDLDDYFKIENDVLLSISYLSFKKKVTHIYLIVFQVLK